MTPKGWTSWRDLHKAKFMLGHIPLGKFAQVENMVDTTLFLLSNLSSKTTSSSSLVDEGFLAA